MTLSKNIVLVIGIRAAALATLLAGKVAEANRLYALADLIDAGSVTDADMAAVAELLKSREVVDADWDQAFANIRAAQARLHAGEPENPAHG